MIAQRDDGSLVDRFRGRVMIPICRESGPIIAFGGRAMEEGQNPKYLNSPETPIYVKGRTLYGLHLSKSAISRTKHAVMVEGYFDVAQALQAGIPNVVASSGTALTAAQARLLKRFASKVVLSFDPDAAGKGAAARTSEMLVGEGFQVNVAMLPAGDDPDNFIQKQGGAAYQEQLRQSRPYLEYLLDRARRNTISKADDRRDFLNRMLEVAARIPDAAGRDQFADRLSHKAQITEEVVRAEIRKSAVQKRTTAPEPERQAPGLSQVKTVEKGLIWAFLRDPEGALAALAELEPGDTDGLATQIDSGAGKIPARMASGEFTGDPDPASKQWRGLAGGRNRPSESPTRRPCRLRSDVETLAVRPRARSCAAGNRSTPGAGRHCPRGRNRLASGAETGFTSAD